MLLVLYVDDACIISSNNDKINAEIKSLQKDYDLADEGELLDYLGTRFDRKPDGSVLLTQPRMVNCELELVGLDKIGNNVTKHDTPATSILDNNPDAKPYNRYKVQL